MITWKSARTSAALMAILGMTACSDDGTGPGPLPDAFAEVVVGEAHACALTDEGAVFCWGSGESGQTGQTGAPLTEPRRVDSDIVFARIAAGGQTTCGVSEAGGLFCWGDNTLGQLGDGSRADSDRPVEVAGGLTWLSVSVGTYHVCGIDSDRRLHCWGGDRWSTALGYPAPNQCETEPTQPLTPCATQPLPGLVDGSFEWVEAGLYQTCMGSVSGEVTCWGTNDLGQLGTSTTGLCPGNDPLHQSSRACSRAGVEPDGGPFTMLSPGSSHTCGLDGVGQAHCWGALFLNFGQIGDGTLDGTPVPVPVASGGPFRAVYTSHEAHIRTFSCGLELDGSALCWGANRFGQLGSDMGSTCGDGEIPCRRTPTPVDGGHRFEQLALGTEFACGLTTGDSILCWGDNVHGQLGDGTQSARAEPGPVSF